MRSRPKLDLRAKVHSSYFAYMCHRFSGLLLACFIPLHFFVLSQSLRGASGFERYLQLTDFWVFKVGEWGLVVLLAIHLIGGTRLLMIEFGPWKGLRKASIQATILFGIVCGILFLYLAN